MKRFAIVAMGLLMMIAISACGGAGDEVGQQFADAANKHAKALNDKKFDKAAFTADMEPICKEIHRITSADSEGKLQMQETIYNAYTKAATALGEAADNEGSDDAQDAMIHLKAWITGKSYEDTKKELQAEQLKKLEEYFKGLSKDDADEEPSKTDDSEKTDTPEPIKTEAEPVKTGE